MAPECLRSSHQRILIEKLDELTYLFDQVNRPLFPETRPRKKSNLGQREANQKRSGQKQLKEKK